MKKFNLIFILLIAFSGSFAADNAIKIKVFKNNNYISIYDLTSKFNLDSTFDFYTGRGRLYYKNHYSVYHVDFSSIIVDGILFSSSYPIIRKKGEIFLPFNLGKKIIKSFKPGLEISRSGRFLKFKKIKITRKLPDNKKVRSSKRYKITFIIIDPGHGGKDPGAIGYGKVKEKYITLKIAKYLEKSLKKRMKRIKIRLTRRNDRFIELSKRTEYANKYLKKHNNGLFLSIHANAASFRRISGFETYFLSQNPTNEDARNTAALENNVIVLEDKKHKKHNYNDIDYIEAMMLTTQIQKESSILANSIQKGIDRKISRFKSRGVRKADFFVLRGSLMPAVLIEVGFLTNKKESKYLRKTKYQKKIAKGISDGVVNFLKKYNKLIK